VANIPPTEKIPMLGGMVACRDYIGHAISVPGNALFFSTNPFDENNSNNRTSKSSIKSGKTTVNIKKNRINKAVSMAINNSIKTGKKWSEIIKNYCTESIKAMDVDFKGKDEQVTFYQDHQDWQLIEKKQKKKIGKGKMQLHLLNEKKVEKLAKANNLTIKKIDKATKTHPKSHKEKVPKKVVKDIIKIRGEPSNIEKYHKKRQEKELEEHRSILKSFENQSQTPATRQESTSERDKSYNKGSKANDKSYHNYINLSNAKQAPGKIEHKKLKKPSVANIFNNIIEAETKARQEPERNEYIEDKHREIESKTTESLLSKQTDETNEEYDPSDTKDMDISNISEIDDENEFRNEEENESIIGNSVNTDNNITTTETPKEKNHMTTVCDEIDEEDSHLDNKQIIIQSGNNSSQNNYRLLSADFDDIDRYIWKQPDNETSKYRDTNKSRDTRLTKSNINDHGPEKKDRSVRFASIAKTSALKLTRINSENEQTPFYQTKNLESNIPERKGRTTRDKQDLAFTANAIQDTTTTIINGWPTTTIEEEDDKDMPKSEMMKQSKINGK
jgi:hypothetical protein